MLYGGVPAGPQYDAMLHAFFLGFVFAMIFAHAPIIFPAVLGARMTYRPLFYAHVLLLQATLLVRLVGDVVGWGVGRQVGGLLNAVMLVLLSLGYIMVAGLVIASITGYMAGLIGASNSPVSGVGILTALGISLILAWLFKGAGEATMGMLSGTIDFQIASTPGVMGHVKGGKARILAVSGAKRLAALPEVPTFAEAGVKNFGLINFTGLWAPKGTPQAVIDAMTAEMKKALGSDELKTTWAGLGANPPATWGPDFGRFVGSEVKRWAEVVKGSGAKLD